MMGQAPNRHMQESEVNGKDAQWTQFFELGDDGKVSLNSGINVSRIQEVLT